MGNGALRAPRDIPLDERRGVFSDCEPSLQGVADLISSGRVKNVVVLCGAGISVSAGIPDFRSPGTGLYANLKKYDLPEGKPESVFELEYFREEPRAFYTLARELYPGTHQPTPCHYFIRLLHEKGVLRRCYTQNIDCLERLAGIPDEKVGASHCRVRGRLTPAHLAAPVGGRLPWQLRRRTLHRVRRRRGRRPRACRDREPPGCGRGQ
jgi:hypothetical protein